MKKKIESILDFIRKMEQNTFLLKDSWSETVPLLKSEYEYRTYVSIRGDKGRYIDIELYKLGVKFLDIKFRENDILLNKPVHVNFSINDVYDIVEMIFEEVHSFRNHDEGLRKLKQDIINKKKRIKDDQSELSKLEQRLKDAIIVSKNQ